MLGIFQYRMRTSMIAVILIMGGLGVSFSILTSVYFEKYTLENRREQLVNLAELEVHYLRDKAITETVDLGMSVQSGKELRKAIKNANKGKVVSLLDQHFYRAFVTLGIIDLEKIFVYDKQFNQLYSSSVGETVTDLDSICSNIIQQLVQRKSTDAIKPFSRMCAYNDKLQLVAVVPIGGLRLTGYLAVVVNPVQNLVKSEGGIGIPLKVKSLTNKTLYQSEDWPTDESLHNILIANYGFKGGNTSPIGFFEFASDITDLHAKLDNTRAIIISVVLLLTLIAIVLSVYVFQHSILSPLNKLMLHLQLVKNDKSYLGKNIEVTGSKDIVKLAESFNAMSGELNSLYSSLEEIAYTDALTGIPNRTVLMDRLNQVILFSKRNVSRENFMFMLLDLNRFKQVNDTYGHNVGDQLLQIVSTRLKKAIRASDTVARLGGDEFAILLNDVTDIKIVEKLANNITQVMSTPVIIDGNTMDIGVSIGIARYPEHGDSVKEIIHHADVAMYKAKQAGLAYCFYEAGME